MFQVQNDHEVSKGKAMFPVFLTLDRVDEKGGNRVFPHYSVLNTGDTLLAKGERGEFKTKRELDSARNKIKRRPRSFLCS